MQFRWSQEGMNPGLVSEAPLGRGHRLCGLGAAETNRPMFGRAVGCGLKCRCQSAGLESSWGSGKGARDLWALVASGVACQQEAIFFLLPLPLIPCVCPCVQIPTSCSDISPAGSQYTLTTSVLLGLRKDCPQAWSRSKALK